MTNDYHQPALIPRGKKEKVFEPKPKGNVLDYTGFKQRHGGDWAAYKKYLFNKDSLSQKLYPTI